MEIKFRYKDEIKIALIDKEDYHLVEDKLILIRGRGYVGVKDRITKEQTYLHRVVMGAEKGQEIDHINKDKLDNRKKNLRFVTRSQNNMNRDARKENKYKGVGWVKKDKVWRCRVSHNGKTICRYFSSEIEAAKERDRLAAEIHGEFASLNFSKKCKRQ